MQKNVMDKKNLLFTKNFVNSFTRAVNSLYKYQSYMDFVIVPSLFGEKTLSYLPLLNYTDREAKEIDDLKELAKENQFQIRVLNFECQTFFPNDTVTMRLDIENNTSENLFTNSIKSRCRNKIRNSIKKYDYTFTYGNKTQNINDFYTIFSATMYKHGTPVLDKKLFYNLIEEFEEKIIFFNAYDNQTPIASMCIVLDEKIAWYAWGGVSSTHNVKLAGYFIYWEVIRHICDNYNLTFFDFGRSSYQGATYKFKSQFGAVPVKIDILSSTTIDIYSHYSLASTLWKKLPKCFVDYLGPKLCKYLVDL